MNAKRVASLAATLIFSSLLFLPPATLAQAPDLFRKENLVAWCIVPFDSQHRTPQQRAEMLSKLGIKQLAYDYRAEHIPTFDDEIEQLKKHQIDLFAWWFPTELNDEAKLILSKLEQHQVKTQLWVTGSGNPTANAAEQRERVLKESARIRPIAEAAARIGCTVGLYNHGGWFGEPDNQIAIIQELKLPNVGIVYNFHHAHSQVGELKGLLERMKPHLLALNLNGMIPNGDNIGQKIVPIGGGSLDLSLLRIVRDSGYIGPIGILNHTDHDAEARLMDNLDGLNWLLPQLNGQPAQAKPTYRTWVAPTTQTSTFLIPSETRVLDGNEAFRHPPLTIVCDALLTQSQQYNILVANDSKASGLHWEMFSQAGSGNLACYLPGYQPSLVVSPRYVCDQKYHRMTMLFEPHRVRLCVDGETVADQAIERTAMPAEPGGFSVGRLVEGGLECFGTIHNLRVIEGIADVSRLLDLKYLQTLNHHLNLSLAKEPESPAEPTPTTADASPYLSYREDTVQRLANMVEQSLATTTATDNPSIHLGLAERGVATFASPQAACLSCHKVGAHGGAVGPDLTKIGTQRSIKQLIESVLWPNRLVEAKYRVTQILTANGELIRGYLGEEKSDSLTITDPSTLLTRTISKEDIEDRTEGQSLMPESLANNWSTEQIVDLITFLADLGQHRQLRLEIAESVLEHAQPHAPKDFPFVREPVTPSAWTHWQDHVNRDRIYDFYAKQAQHFRSHDLDHRLLMEFPGLDGGNQGHWGNQNESTWASDDWNDAELGSVQAGVFTPPGKTITRGVGVQLGMKPTMFACFDIDALDFAYLWKGEFVQFSSVRHGFVNGLTPNGEPIPLPHIKRPTGPTKYHGFYRIGPKVVFAYRIGDREYLDAAWIREGQFAREFGPRESHSMRDQLHSGAPQWPQVIETEIRLGTQSPYAIDTIELPLDNPWKSPVYCGGHDFLPDGSALVATMQGDVWHVSGFSNTQGSSSVGKAKWRRFASGLHHALGVKTTPQGVFVLCRDQLMRLHDLNKDGEADYYECVSVAFETSPAGHDYICGLEQDQFGNFYTASGNQGLVRIAPDGQRAEAIAEGFRNPDGLGIYPDGVVTVPCSEGEWTPASMIAAVTPSHLETKGLASAADFAKANSGPGASTPQPPFYGYRGSKFSKRPLEKPLLPLVYLPRGLDNSAGGQTYIDSRQWGPLSGQMVHLSFGTASHFLLLRDQVDNQLQGAVVQLQGDFLSGVHRGRFHPIDGQLYVCGMAGWGSYSEATGCFQRVRYTGKPVQLPVRFHVYQNGIELEFSQPLASSASDPQAHFAQAWNYRYSAAYGSSEYSALHYGVRGHDRLKIQSSVILDDGKTIFLELPELVPCNQLHLSIGVSNEQAVDIYLTCNQLDRPRSGIPGLSGTQRVVAGHPIERDMEIAAKRLPNPWRNTIANARKIEIRADKNLSFHTRTLTAKAGESLALVFSNPDVVPHNWVLVQPGKLATIGAQANRLVGDPEGMIRHYVPQSPDVVCFTDIVDPQDQATIYFRVPSQAGRYPYLCTFPGHWMVMNGELIVEPR